MLRQSTLSSVKCCQYVLATSHTNASRLTTAILKPLVKTKPEQCNWQDSLQNGSKNREETDCKKPAEIQREMIRSAWQAKRACSSRRSHSRRNVWSNVGGQSRFKRARSEGADRQVIYANGADQEDIRSEPPEQLEKTIKNYRKSKRESWNRREIKKRKIRGTKEE